MPPSVDVSYQSILVYIKVQFRPARSREVRVTTGTADTAATSTTHGLDAFLLSSSGGMRQQEWSLRLGSYEIGPPLASVSARFRPA